jgi:cell division septation protein DedD
MSDPLPSYRVRPQSRGGPPGRWILFILGFALIGGAATWDALDGRPDSVPLIEADRRPVRVRPADPGGLQVENQDALIFDRDPWRQRAARLSPAPEEPRLDLLSRLVEQPSEASSAPASTPAAAAAGPDEEDAPALAAGSAATAPEAPADAPGADGVQVQIGALPSEAAAGKEWMRLSRRAPALFGDLKPLVSRFERDGQATLFRLRTGPLRDAEAAQAFCDRLRAAGGNCFVVPPPTT